MGISQIILWIQILRFVVDLIKGKDVDKAEFKRTINNTDAMKDSTLEHEDVVFLVDAIKAFSKEDKKEIEN